MLYSNSKEKKLTEETSATLSVLFGYLEETSATLPILFGYREENSATL